MIPDSSTTTAQIPILSLGGCWAWAQLDKGIRFISIAIKLTILHFSVQVVPWQNSIRLQITLEPLLSFRFSSPEVGGLDSSYTMV